MEIRGISGFLGFGGVLASLLTVACGAEGPESSDRTLSAPDAEAELAATQQALFSCGLPPGPSTNVRKPSGVVGNLKVLNWAGFKAAVSYTFDDANSSQIQHYSELNSLGVPLTFYLITGKVEASNAIWKQAVANGHEIGNHTKSHLSAGSAADVDAATTFIQQSIGVRPWTFAAPNGDASYRSIAQSRFLVSRGVANGSVAPNDATDPFNLPTFIPAAGAPAASFNNEVDAARTSGRWKTVLVHGFTGGSDAAYQPVALDQFVQSVNHTKSFGDVWTDTMTKVGAYWIGQKVFSAVTPTTAGSTKTWRWTLPANFPPGKCLRITVTGGTVKQGGVALPWNTHGYYEIALDTGSVSLSP
ncbi:MAG TPA: polysaccharide deacetylase family protein [Polyangiaceae bacterium]|nr:polysaccharide deacetylase family protein [Polyangiaceae bacterium]